MTRSQTSTKRGQLWTLPRKTSTKVTMDRGGLILPSVTVGTLCLVLAGWCHLDFQRHWENDFFISLPHRFCLHMDQEERGGDGRRFRVKTDPLGTQTMGACLHVRPYVRRFVCSVPDIRQMQRSLKRQIVGDWGYSPPPPPTTSSRHFQCNLIGLFGGKFRPFGRYLVIAGVHSLLEPVERVLSAKRTPFCTKCTKRNCKKGEATTCREELCCGWPVPPRWRIALPAPTFSFSFFLSLSFFLFFFFYICFLSEIPPLPLETLQHHRKNNKSR